MVEEYNRAILETAAHFQHDLFLTVKGSYIQASTLRSLAQRGIRLYNYYPDTSAFQWGSWLPAALPEYDCVFYTKPFWRDDVTKRINLKDAYFIPHGYDPSLHRPFILDPRDISDYQCDVSLIATHSSHKEEILADLIRLRPNLTLCIWGDHWTRRCRFPELRRCIKGFPLLGERYSRAIQAARINLAIMSGSVPGASSGDLTTHRSYAIPASGGFMLHERNSEVLQLYREGEEIGCFDSVEELADKIDYYLVRAAEREALARAGHARCVPAYSYDNRMAELLRWHFEHSSALDAPSDRQPTSLVGRD